MAKAWRYILIPVAAFVVALIIFARVLNQGISDPTMQMSEASLPVVYMVYNGERINELHGYTAQMDPTSMRDTVTPVESGGVLPIRIDAYGNDITSVTYEVRSLDAERLVQESEVEDLSISEDEISADLPIQNLLTPGEEYLLILTVETAGDPRYFYTRIVEEDTSSIEETVAFVRDFHKATMNKYRQSDLTTYMETTGSEDNTTLHTVTLRNSLSQVCWGDLHGTEVTEPVICIQEISDSFNVILMRYVLSFTDEEDNVSYYNVEEYYRVRRGIERLYLLNFERTVEEIFTGDNGETPSQDLLLGIRSPDVDFWSNESGTEICFVQAGELWNYSAGTDALTRIYGFRSEDPTDAREDYGEHDIRVIRMDESGSVDFAVCGYMNRGMHEGQVGISVCHYDSATSTVEEEAFIPSEDSYQTLSAEISESMYVSDAEMLYLLRGDLLYCLDLKTKKYEVEIADMTPDNHAGSADGRYLAWTTGDLSQATTLYLLDLETGRTGQIEAPDGYLIRPLGFLGTDCVYGLAERSDVLAEDYLFPMGRVEVADFSTDELEVVKTYETDGVYVTGATVTDGAVYLTRMMRQGGGYTEIDEDIVYNREMQGDQAVTVVTTYDEVRETQVELRLPIAIQDEPDVEEAMLIRVGNTERDLFADWQKKEYYVYARGRAVLATSSRAEAEALAEEIRGVVVAADQTCVWELDMADSGG